MKNVCVFLSAADLSEKYTDPAKEFGRLLAEAGYTYLYGGSERGLMKVVADSVDEAGGKIIGVSMEMLKQTRRMDADEMYIAADLPERKKLLGEKSDAIVVLTGGNGTLDEVTEWIELKKLKQHNKPIVFLNTDGFWNDLKNMYMRMESEGFLPMKLADLIVFLDTPKDVIEYLDKNLLD